MKPVRIEEILERQVRSWDMQRRLARAGGEAARRALAHAPEGPWITLSRELGAGGLALAGRVGDELGWQVYDHEILGAIARRTETTEAFLARLDEHAVGPVNDYLASLLDSRNVGRVPFLQEMMRVVWGLAKQGSAVIVGRGGNWILGGRYGIRVRVVAPRDVRVARVAEREGLGAAAAARRLDEHDESQRAFIRQVYDRAIDDPLGYDLVMNMAEFDEGAAAACVIAALRARLDPVEA